MAAEDEPTWVYQYRDPAGVLLYIGITNNPLRRLKEHAEFSAWFRHVSPGGHYAEDRYPGRAIAAEVERGLIIAEQPVYNREHQPDLDFATAVRESYIARMHTVLTSSSAAGRVWEYRLTCWLCPRWEAWAGNQAEAERWADEHLATAT